MAPRMRRKAKQSPWLGQGVATGYLLVIFKPAGRIGQHLYTPEQYGSSNPGQDLYFFYTGPPCHCLYTGPPRRRRTFGMSATSPAVSYQLASSLSTCSGQGRAGEQWQSISAGTQPVNLCKSRLYQ
eukprot:239752-Chlamydomonas_euryale.AAC.11